MTEKYFDPSQIAGTPEWKARVQAEAAGRFLSAISGAAAALENKHLTINPTKKYEEDKPNTDD
jgi:hypothetical protein